MRIKLMKTTLEMPDTILRRAKSAAAQRGITLRQFVIEAICEKLGAASGSANKPWIKSFGKLHYLRKETARINRLIEDEFEQIERP